MSAAFPDCTVLSVNVGRPTAVPTGPRSVVSGIAKDAVPGRVRVTEAGLDGDHVMNRKHHGGPDQAVYVYTLEDYRFWAAQLERALPPGLFGENLLVGGLESAPLRVGDQLETRGPGDEAGVLLEVTAPRIPCATLAAHVGEAEFVKRFAAAVRPGAYARVLRGGEVGASDKVRLIPAAADAPTLGELFGLWYSRAPDPQRLRHHLRFPLAERLRASVEEQLARAQAQPSGQRAPEQ